jgi:hypothetical protein
MSTLEAYSTAKVVHSARYLPWKGDACAVQIKKPKTPLKSAFPHASRGHDAMLTGRWSLEVGHFADQSVGGDQVVV